MTLPIISKLWTKSGKTYEIVDGGFRPGAVQYIDRGYTLQSVPDCLMGQTYIKTAGSDKMYEEHEDCLSFETDGPVTVYVIHADKFQQKPRWMLDFRNTGQKVTRTDSSLETMKGIFTVFAKEFGKGAVRLGGCLPPGMLTPDFVMSGGTTYCMYTVVVAAK